jgi:ABC-type molybdenum transport system ATPase subunit/photorepair protein PhrA
MRGLESHPRTVLTPALPTLAAVDLACRRGDRILFKGLQFEAKPGQVVWLRGANGRGNRRTDNDPTDQGGCGRR